MITTPSSAGVMLAFIDNFKMLGVVFFAVIPIWCSDEEPRVPAGGVAGSLRKEFRARGREGLFESRGQHGQRHAVEIQLNNEK